MLATLEYAQSFTVTKISEALAMSVTVFNHKVCGTDIRKKLDNAY